MDLQTNFDSSAGGWVSQTSFHLDFITSSGHLDRAHSSPTRSSFTTHASVNPLVSVSHQDSLRSLRSLRSATTLSRATSRLTYHKLSNRLELRLTIAEAADSIEVATQILAMSYQFQFPSQHHSQSWNNSRPSSSRDGGVQGLNRETARSALDFLVEHDLSHPRKADQIQPGLYIGDLASAKDFDALETKRITHVLSVCHCPELKYPDSMKINHKVIEADDATDEDLLDRFLECWRFISNAINEGGRIHVHCEQGISRSATVVAAFLMKEERWHPDQALRHIKKFRPIIDPNEGFRQQLDLWGQCRGVLPGNIDYLEWKRKRASKA